MSDTSTKLAFDLADKLDAVDISESDLDLAAQKLRDYATALERIAELERIYKIQSDQANDREVDIATVIAERDTAHARIATLQANLDRVTKDAKKARGILQGMLLHATPIGDGQRDSVIPTITLQIAGEELKRIAAQSAEHEGKENG